MDWYYYIAIAMIVTQVSFSLLVFKNYRYALSRYKRDRNWYRPCTTLIVPCKGEDLAFEKNVTSFFNQDYENYQLWFVVGEESDPAYARLCELKDQLSDNSKAQDIQILIAGHAQGCSQKLHNLLYCCHRIGDDVEILAFADSDACIRGDWLSHIVYPLRQSKNGAASGYRWFIPKTNNAATLALSALNAKIAQLLGNTRFNQAWGGSMAVRVDVFRRLGMEEIWAKTSSDDLSLSYAVKKAGLKVAFVPACLVASYESTTWGKLFEFGRRQFLITRVSSARTWRLGLVSASYSTLGLWAAAVVAIYAAVNHNKNLPLFIAVPVLFFTSQLVRAILRQKMISKLLKDDLPKMKVAMVTDILFFWAWSPLLLVIIISSAFGRTITWRGIRYKLLGPTETIVVGNGEDKK